MNTPRKKVLVADCHEEVLIALERMLEDAGFDTTTVWTARDVLSLVDSQVFDLVLVNEYLPDAECEDLLKALRKRGARMPCVVMQPSAPEITDFTGLQALGVNDIVCKYAYRQVVEVVMDANYMLACGIVWRKTADPEAGWELVEGLQSPDPSLRLLAQNLLVETGEDSMDLLEDAVAKGILSPEVAGPCMAEILRSGQARQTREQAIKQHLGDVLLC